MSAQILPALNDFCDAIEALPADLVRNFTLLREVDSKTVGLQAQLIEEIQLFMDELPMESTAIEGSKAPLIDPPQQALTDGLATVARPVSQASAVDRDVSDAGTEQDVQEEAHQRASERLVRIKELIMQGFAYSDEKVSVASAAADVVSRHMARLDRDFALLRDVEIPQHLREGTPPPRINSVQAAIRNAPKRIEPPSNKKPSVTTTSGKQSSAVHPAVGYREETANGGVHVKQGGTSGQGSGGGAHHNAGSHGSSYAESKVTVSRTGRQSKPRRRSLSPLLPAKVAAQAAAAIANAPDDEPTYCYCNQVSYGEMVACDGDDCEREWFHLACVNLTAPPRGSWFCDACKKVTPPAKRRR